MGFWELSGSFPWDLFDVLRSRINCNPGNEKYVDLVVEKVRNPRNSELDPSWSSWAGVRNPREEENRENPGNSALGSAPL